MPKQEPMDEEASSHHDLRHRRLCSNRLSSDLSSKKLIEALFCIRRSHFTPIYSCFRLRRTGTTRCVKGYWQGCAGPWDPRGKDFRFSLTRQAPNFVVHFSLCLATGSPKPTALELRGRDSALWRSRADRARVAHLLRTILRPAARRVDSEGRHLPGAGGFGLRSARPDRIRESGPTRVLVLAASFLPVPLSAHPTGQSDWGLIRYGGMGILSPDAVASQAELGVEDVV